MTFLLLFSLISKGQLKEKFEPSASSINHILDSLTYLKTKAQKLNKTDPTSKNNQVAWGNYSNYFELQFKPHLNEIIVFISQISQDSTENKFLTFLSISTGSADEELSNSFAKLFINKPDQVIRKLQAIGQDHLNKFLHSSFDFFVSQTKMEAKQLELLTEKIQKLHYTNH